MERLLLLLLLLLPAFPAGAGEPYFCTREGRTLYYERYDAGSTKLRRTTTFEITSVRQEASGQRVDYDFTLRKANGAELYGGTAPMSVRISSDGTVQMDLGGSLRAVLRNLFPRQEITSSGGAAVLPAAMKPGDALPDAHCVVDVAGVKYHIDVTEREVLRTERVTVPAGTFDAVVVREHKVERGPGHNRNTWSDSWYVAGIGYVRHDTYDRNLRPDTSEVLKNY